MSIAGPLGVHQPIKDDYFELTEQLKRSKRQFETVAENAPDVICRFDKEYRQVYVNPAITVATGVPAAAFVGKTLIEVGLPKRHAQMWNKHLKNVFATAKHITIEFEFPTPIGAKYYQSRLVPEFDNDGNVETVLSISRDITQMKEQEQKKDEFLAIVSHELKTPITSLKAFAQVVSSSLTKSGDTKNAQYFSKMESQLNRLNGLVGDLLDVTKISSGKLQFINEKFSFDSLVARVVEEIQHTTSHKIQIKGKTNKQVFGDANRVGQVLTNLLTNAIKYSPNTNEINVHLATKGQEVSCCVEDFGIGISKANQVKVFERFVRENSKKGLYPGLGLGLYIASHIVKKHGGKIWVDSEEKKGSKFYFTIPLK